MIYNLETGMHDSYFPHDVLSITCVLVSRLYCPPEVSTIGVFLFSDIVFTTGVLGFRDVEFTTGVLRFKDVVTTNEVIEFSEVVFTTDVLDSVM